MICFDCFGNGKVKMLSKESPTITCERCHGVGEIPNEAAEWVEAGKLMEYTRLQKRCTLREASKQTNIDVITLSEMESGIVEPDPSLYENLHTEVLFKSKHSTIGAQL